MESRNIFRLCWILVPVLLINCGHAQGSVCKGKILGIGKICCNGKVHNGTNELGQELHCCNGKYLYVESEQLCCGTQNVIDRFENGKERLCCQGLEPALTDRVFVSEENEFCCNGLVQKLSKHQNIDNFDCCGTILIDSTKEKCCKTKDLKNQTLQILRENEDCCGASKYNVISHWCHWEHERVLRIGMDLCGNIQYNVSSEVCCSGKDIKKTNGRGKWTCWNGIVYDEDKQYWHKKGQMVLDHDKDLCNDVVYEKQSQECCNGCLHNRTQESECCGTGYLVNPVSERCCDNTIFNPTVQQCCNWQVINNHDQGCCGTMSYNLTQEVCCENSIQSLSTPVEKIKPNDTDCCFYDKRPYNEFTEECKKDGVCPKQSDQPPQSKTQVPEESLEDNKPVNQKSPFCKAGKLAQIKKTCEKKNEFLGWLMSVDTTSKWMTIKIFGLWPKSVRERVIDIQVRAKAKCIEKWDGLIWVITNRRLRRNGKHHSLKITHRDLLMQDSRRNRNLRSWYCKNHS